jgi:hypothetical protein
MLGATKRRFIIKYLIIFGMSGWIIFLIVDVCLFIFCYYKVITGEVGEIDKIPNMVIDVPISHSGKLKYGVIKTVRGDVEIFIAGNAPSDFIEILKKKRGIIFGYFPGIKDFNQFKQYKEIMNLSIPLHFEKGDFWAMWKIDTTDGKMVNIEYYYHQKDSTFLIISTFNPKTIPSDIGTES